MYKPSARYGIILTLSEGLPYALNKQKLDLQYRPSDNIQGIRNTRPAFASHIYEDEQISYTGAIACPHIQGSLSRNAST